MGFSPCTSARHAPALLLFLLFLLLGPALFAQLSPTLTIDQEVAAFAFATDGRIAYAERRVFNQGKLVVQRDDVWIAARDGKKTRIIHGEKMFRGPAPFSYSIHSLRWSLDATRLAIEMFTSVMTDLRGETKDAFVIWLLDPAGKEIKIGNGPGMIEDGYNAAWLPDGVTLVYLHEAVSPKLLYSIRTLRPLSARGDTLFDNHVFASVAWDLRPGAPGAAVAIERDASLTGPIRLVWLDLQKQQRRELAALESYSGQLSVSPTGKQAAYFLDQETLEIREIARPENFVRLRVAYGNYVWAPDERRILLKRGLFDAAARGSSARRSGSLVWVTVPTLEPQPAAKSAQPAPEAELQPALSGLLFQGFAISPDGRSLAVTAPGARPLQLYPIQ